MLAADIVIKVTVVQAQCLMSDCDRMTSSLCARRSSSPKG
jgi:hypothetical protein